MADDDSSLFGLIKGLFGGESPSSSTKVIIAKPMGQYPTDEDVDSAKKNDWSYGQPWAPEFEGHSARLLSGSPNVHPMKTETLGTTKTTMDKLIPPTTNPLKNYYAKAALASEGSGLAKLGFDPNKTAVDLLRDPKKTNILGRYTTGTSDDGRRVDEIYANARDPSSIVHESMHRGLQKLHDSPFWKPDFDEMFQDPMNEHLVRYLMKNKAGDPEASDIFGKGDRDDSDFDFTKDFGASKRRKLADQIEESAANLVAAKRPGGPR